LEWVAELGWVICATAHHHWLVAAT